jgi:hypothetical protein
VGDEANPGRSRLLEAPRKRRGLQFRDGRQVGDYRIGFRGSAKAERVAMRFFGSKHFAILRFRGSAKGEGCNSQSQVVLARLRESGEGCNILRA